MVVPDLNFKNALRDCCRDEAAFERLQQLLAPHLSPHLYDETRSCQTLQPEEDVGITQPSTPMPSSACSVAELHDLIATYRAQLHQKSLEIQELKRLKEVALHTIAHDLKTFVMGTLMVSKQLLEQTGELLTIPRSKVERIIQASDRQLGLIGSLLETQITEEQGVILHPIMVRFDSLVQTILQDLHPLLAANQTTLVNQIPTALPLVTVDPCQIYRMFEHLLVTIMQHNPPGLSLTLTAVVEEGMLRCTLQDDGVGMSRVECSRLFELHVHNPQARCSTGIGVKLYLCKQIITAHGGQIGAISSPKQGATFWFTLPLVEGGT